MVLLDDIKTKIELLCWGLKPNRLSEDIFLYQNPFHHKRTGNAGLQLLIGISKLAANIPTGDKFTRGSPFHLKICDDEYWIFRNDRKLIQCTVIPVPDWYKLNITEGTPIGKVLLQEGTSTLITAVYNSCDYIGQKETCRFCAIGRYASKKSGIVRKTPVQIAESLKIIQDKADLSNFTIDLTGGNTQTEDRGALMYVEIIRAIRKISNIPICVEIAPPDKDEYLNMLFDIGANSFMLNLEIWDDKLRKLFLPGKSKITKTRYFQAWEHAIKLVGTGKVSSVLIVGLESKYSTLEGADNLIKHGVIPTIMPFRPNDGSYLENLDCPSPESVLYITHEVSEKLFTNGINPLSHPGCISCGACAAEGDYYKSYVFDNLNGSSK